MDAAGRSWGTGAQPPCQWAQAVEEGATEKSSSLGYVLAVTQATAQDPEALSSSITSAVESSTRCLCAAQAQAMAEEREAVLGELWTKRKTNGTNMILIIVSVKNEIILYYYSCELGVYMLSVAPFYQRSLSSHGMTWQRSLIETLSNKNTRNNGKRSCEPLF